VESSSARKNIYIYIIYTPNLEFRITVFDREREQGRFRGSSEGVRESTEGVGGSTKGAAREHYGAAVSGSLKWSRLKLPSLLFCCLDFVTSHRILLTAEVIIKLLT